jgi:hypothetical protein
MMESILTKESAVSRHKQAPVLKERVQFLRQLQLQATSRKALCNMAAESMHVSVRVQPAVRQNREALDCSLLMTNLLGGSLCLHCCGQMGQSFAVGP